MTSPAARPLTTADHCIRGAEQELARDLDGARRSYRAAWDAAATDPERCIAAHYLGHLSDDLDLQLAWHRRALDFAARSAPELVGAFYPSLHACLGRTLTRLGRDAEAAPHLQRAAELGFPLT